MKIILKDKHNLDLYTQTSYRGHSINVKFLLFLYQKNLGKHRNKGEVGGEKLDFYKKIKTKHIGNFRKQFYC